MNYEGKSVFQLVEQKEDPQVAINTADIAINTSNIAATAANVATNTGEIATLESNVRAGLSGSYFGTALDFSDLNKTQYQACDIDVQLVAWPLGLGIETPIEDSYPAVLAGTYATSSELFPVTAEGTVVGSFAKIRHQPISTSQKYRYVFDWEGYWGLTRVLDIQRCAWQSRVYIDLYDTLGVKVFTLRGVLTETEIQSTIGVRFPIYVSQKIAYTIDWRLHPTAVYAEMYLTNRARTMFTNVTVFPFQVDSLWNKDGTKRNCFHVEVYKTR